MPERVLVCGGRDYADAATLYRNLDAIHGARPIEVIIQGGYRGADVLAKRWAKLRNVQDIEIKAEWTRFGPAAGPIRNQRMLDEGKPTLVMAFPGGNGTADMVRKAHAAGVAVVVVDDD